MSAIDRVQERRRAVALAYHYRDEEGLSIAEIARQLGRAKATVKAYLYDPTGEKARAVKARYVGVCRGCGAYTQPRNGKGDAYRYCKACHPGAIARRWTRERVIAAMREWRPRYGRLPSSYDWSRTHARRRGGEPLERLARGEWPAASVVTRLFGTWAVASAAARQQHEEEPSGWPPSPGLPLGSNSISLLNPRESTSKSANPSGGVATTKPLDFQVFLTTTQSFASVRSPVQIRAPRLNKPRKCGDFLLARGEWRSGTDWAQNGATRSAWP